MDDPLIIHGNSMDNPWMFIDSPRIAHDNFQRNSAQSMRNRCPFMFQPSANSCLTGLKTKKNFVWWTVAHFSQFVLVLLIGVQGWLFCTRGPLASSHLPKRADCGAQAARWYNNNLALDPKWKCCIMDTHGFLASRVVGTRSNPNSVSPMSWLNLSLQRLQDRDHLAKITWRRSYSLGHWAEPHTVATNWAEIIWLRSLSSKG